jgi:transcriptional regulator of acetoin/glycerol metabolism
MIELAAIQCRSGLIQAEHIRLQSPLDEICISTIENNDNDKDKEKTRILKALDDARWNRRLAAQKLGMPYSTLRYKLKNYGIT